MKPGDFFEQTELDESLDYFVGGCESAFQLLFGQANGDDGLLEQVFEEDEVVGRRRELDFCKSLIEKAAMFFTDP